MERNESRMPECFMAQENLPYWREVVFEDRGREMEAKRKREILSFAFVGGRGITMVRSGVFIGAVWLHQNAPRAGRLKGPRVSGVGAA